MAEKRQIRLHLRMSMGKPPGDLKKALEFLERVGAPNLRLAPSTALLLAEKPDPAVAAGRWQDRVGLWLVSATANDIAGHVWNTHAPIARSGQEHDLSELIALAPDVPIVLDAVYKSLDQEYLDARALDGLLVCVDHRP